MPSQFTWWGGTVRTHLAEPVLEQPPFTDASKPSPSARPCGDNVGVPEPAAQPTKLGGSVGEKPPIIRVGPEGGM